MNCPKCNHEQKCPCPTCIKRHKADKPWQWCADGHHISCGNCGLVMSSDEWIDLEWRQFKQSKDEWYEYSAETESIRCDSRERFVNAKTSRRWEYVSCKNCLKMKEAFESCSSGAKLQGTREGEG